LKTKPGALIVITAACAALLFSACATGRLEPHPNLAPAWREFRKLPPVRAMAVAGDPRRDRWVSGAAGCFETRSEAEAGALRECGLRRRARRLPDACALYAVGNEVVWKGP
jgi:hypothetical protein